MLVHLQDSYDVALVYLKGSYDVALVPKVGLATEKAVSEGENYLFKTSNTPNKFLIEYFPLKAWGNLLK